MNRRFVSVLAFAFVVAAIATLLFYRLVAGRLGSAPKPVATTKVLVAARELTVGTLIKDVDVGEKEWLGPPPQNSVLKKEDLVGRGVVARIYAGEPIIESRLAAKGAGAGLAAMIPTGMRAVAVRVNEVVGVAGFVVPGMRVDVLIAGVPPNSPQNLGTLSKTLLQNIEVLSAGQNIQKDAEGKPISVPVVNLLVTPEQAETLSLATSETRIQLVLRNPLDTQTAKTPGTAVAQLFSGQRLAPPASGGGAPRTPSRAAPPPPVVEKKPPPPIVVEVLHGGRKVETSFPRTSEERP
ncbi:MAG: Flp pilus assembly protein CpaB [Acidobacteria bacterium]|nr:Flp pilus assembly protein CpaB [Acidobacteriota bacterium]